MKLHWSPRSPFVRKVMVAVHELGIADRLTLVRSVAAMRTPNPKIMADNPLSKIPTLVLDDGSALFDSLTICEYLDDLVGGGRLFPPASADRWRMLTWHALANGTLDLLILWRNERMRAEAQQMPDLLAAFATKLDASLARLERDMPAIGATPFGVGHVAIACMLAYLDFRFDDIDWRTDHPALAAWQADAEKRPSMIATEVVDD